MDKHWIRYSIKWSTPLIKAYKWNLILILGLTLISVGLGLVQVNFIQRSIDAVLIRDINTLICLLVLFISLTVFRMVHGYLYGYYFNKVFVYINRDMKYKFINKILKTKMKYINKESSGDLSIKCNSDIPNAIGFIFQGFSNFFLNPLISLGGFIYLFCYNWKLSLFVFIPLPILVILLNIMSSKASAFYKAIQGFNSDYTQQINDVIHGAGTIKAYNMQRVQMNKIRKTLTQILKKDKQYGFNNAVTLVLIMSVTYLPQVIALIYGAYLVTTGEIRVSLLFGYAQLIPTICSPAISLFGSLISIKNSYQSMKRIDTVMELEEEEVNSRLLDTTCEIAIQFKDVQFAYGSSNSPVLDNFDLQINKGQCVGLVGNSGAGKSTIIQLLCGLYEIEKGKIELFGQNIQSLNLDDLRSHISYVSQQAYIIPGTIYDNVHFSNINATKEEVERAVEWAGLKEYINTLPDGLQTVLSEDGSNMSGGQRQRLSLARAFLRSSLINIFDEPTSSLDPETERRIMQRIDEVVKQKDKTSVIVSHNIKIIENCDLIFYLQDGKIIEAGTFEELLKNKSAFYNQFKYTLEV